MMITSKDGMGGTCSTCRDEKFIQNFDKKNLKKTI